MIIIIFKLNNKFSPLLSRFPLSFRLDEIELFHEVGSAVWEDDSGALDEGFFVVDDGIEENLIVGIHRLVGRDELADEDKIGTSIRIFLFLIEVVIEEFLGFVVVEILVGSRES